MRNLTNVHTYLVELRNIKLILEYDGTSYHGWQRQPNLPTVQEAVEESLSRLFKEEIKVIAAGRTDAHVHAKGQVINFKTRASLPIEAIKPALNSYLPDDIRVKKAECVPLNFHARRDALKRTYRYIIYNHPFSSPFYRNFAWYIPDELSLEEMKKASRHLIGKHDFSSFQAQGSPAPPVRRLERISIFKREKFIITELTADSFLYRMVRNIMGTLVEVGRGRLSPDEVRDILEAKDRKFAGPTAPPQGLYLMRVEYG